MVIYILIDCEGIIWALWTVDKCTISPNWISPLSCKLFGVLKLPSESCQVDPIAVTGARMGVLPSWAAVSRGPSSISAEIITFFTLLLGCVLFLPPSLGSSAP